mmetsp:Transcript_12774/g.24548  ORF Transcript_12774/g.24548 Transcript_12774/m.24548 type:complete len:125 (-) Transcript_12774:125-499(-)
MGIPKNKPLSCTACNLPNRSTTYLCPCGTTLRTVLADVTGHRHGLARSNPQPLMERVVVLVAVVAVVVAAVEPRFHNALSAKTREARTPPARRQAVEAAEVAAGNILSAIVSQSVNESIYRWLL